MTNYKGFISGSVDLSDHLCVGPTTPYMDVGYGESYGTVYGSGLDYRKGGVIHIEPRCVESSTKEATNNLSGNIDYVSGFGMEYGVSYGGYKHQQLPRTSGDMEVPPVVYSVDVLDGQIISTDYNPIAVSFIHSGGVLPIVDQYSGQVFLLSKAFSVHNQWLGLDFIEVQ